LLCEQVVGRGLRRTSYEVNPATGLFEPEYVNIFGIPFSFLPHEGDGMAVNINQQPKIMVSALSEKCEYEITWPNISSIRHELNPHL
jgi:type III restriction enzyme